MFDETKATNETVGTTMDDITAQQKINEVMANVEDTLGELNVNDFVNYVKMEKLITNGFISNADIKLRLHNRATDIVCDMIENVASISGLLDNMSHMYERLKNDDMPMSEKKEATVVLNHAIETINSLMENITNLNDELVLMGRAVEFYQNNFQ